MPVPGPIKLLAALLLAGGAAAAQAQAQGPAAAPGTAAPGVRAGQPAAGQPAKPRPDTRPSWAELTGTQQQALRPLAASWSGMSEAQKRKWIALSSNYHAMPAAEQAKLHSRMAEWVALSPQQRAQARLNFGEAKGLAPDDRKAKWEAYQALPEDERRKLAAGSVVRTSPTAPALRPVPPQKLATVPRSGGETKQPRIATGLSPEPPAAPVTATPTGQH